MTLAAEVYQALGMGQALCVLYILAHAMLLQEVRTIPGPWYNEDTDAHRSYVTCLSHKAEVGQKLTLIGSAK